MFRIALCFEKRIHVGSDHVYFFGVCGSGRMASQSADPVTAGSGVGVLDHPGVRKLGVVKSIALEECDYEGGRGGGCGARPVLL